MKRLVIAVALAGQTGCVTTATIVKRPDRVSVPLLLVAVAGDFFVTALAVSEIQDASTGTSLATGAAVMAADAAVGCILGGCAALRP